MNFIDMAQVSAQKCSLCDENNGSNYCYECQHALCTVCRKRHDITDVVLEEREKAKENIQELKLKTEAISSLQEKIRREHIEKLHVESKKCTGHIESVCKDLQSYIEAKGSIKTTEVEDNEKIENQNFEAFLKNTDLIHKRYVNILSELENLLLEKHDVTFYSGYRSIQSDIETLVSIPDEPLFARVPRFEDETLYREVMEHMESKMDNSLCQNCAVHKKQIEDLQSEYNICKETFHRDLESKDDELKTLSEDIKSLKEEKNTMQSTFTNTTNRKEAENKKLLDNIECLKKEIEKKNDEFQKVETQPLEEKVVLLNRTSVRGRSSARMRAPSKFQTSDPAKFGDYYCSICTKDFGSIFSLQTHICNPSQK